MVRFLLKVCLLISVLFFGIILGFIGANNGLQKIRGKDHEAFEKVITVTEEDGDYEATILGETVTSHNIEVKKKQLEQFQTYNLFTDIAKKITSLLNHFFATVFS